ncbi:MAG TPA: flagellar assembly protein FliW [Defluviitaleaceae bacterium]|jgi:flagellar assembly factor FliW|nr:flagellar assembly protein FliW [Candidatus Epulonipiscium sp.]HOA80254.1 flagellar assembly protein FliW [Defluviitaleaceae bacterium]
MILNTKHFGQIQIQEDKILIFEEGIPGFPNNKKYVLICDEENEDSPFCWLQSVEDENIAFALLNPTKIYSNYSPKVDDDLIKSLGDFSANDLALYCIVVIPENYKKMTVNLKAPIVINTITKKGMQIIAENEEYEIRHNIFNDLTEYTSTKEGV